MNGSLIARTTYANTGFVIWRIFRVVFEAQRFWCWQRLLSFFVNLNIASVFGRARFLEHLWLYREILKSFRHIIQIKSNQLCARTPNSNPIIVQLMRFQTFFCSSSLILTKQIIIRVSLALGFFFYGFQNTHAVRDHTSSRALSSRKKGLVKTNTIIIITTKRTPPQHHSHTWRDGR